MAKPPPDDVRDVIAAAVSICKAPSPQRQNQAGTGLDINFSKRFGGVTR